MKKNKKRIHAGAIPAWILCLSDPIYGILNGGPVGWIEIMGYVLAVAIAEKDFKDVAYFEPVYLKEFVASKPKKLL